MIKKNKLFVGIIALALCGGLYYTVQSNKGELKDGVYKAFGDTYSERGYKPFMVVEVKNGKMVDALIEYVDAEGRLLTKNDELKYEYSDEFGNFPEGFTKEIRAEFLIKQGTETLEKVTDYEAAGTTFKKLADKLIAERIKVGKEEVLTVKL